MTLIISYYYTQLIILYYYTQLEQLMVETNQVKSVQSGSCIQSHHIFKNIWNSAVLERLNYGKISMQWSISSSGTEHVFVPSRVCLTISFPLFLVKWGSPNSVQCMSWQVLVQQHCFCYYAFVCVKSAGCQKLVQIWFGDSGKIIKLPKINTTTNFPCHLYGTARTWSWNLTTGSSQLA